MIKNKISLLLLFASVLLFSCKKDKIDTVYVPDYLKQMLPYSDGQIIHFVDSNGETTEATIIMTSGFQEKSNCPSCPVYIREEYYKYAFKVGNRQFIQLDVDVRPNIFMSIFSPLDDFQFGAGFDFMTQDRVAQFICNGPRQTCINSIILNGKIYTNVLEIISGAVAADQLTKAYYSTTLGLIGFRYGNGFTYTRQ